MASKRIEWLDVAKGIGILSVIAGHCISINDPICQWIFMFHMPLFFLLSGYTFSAKDGFFKTALKKAKTLLVPFAAFFSLGLVVTLLWSRWRQGLTVSGIKTDLILADPTHVHNSSIWFLVCLFFVSLLFWLIQKLPVWVQLPLVAAVFAAGIWYARHRGEFTVFGYNRLPLNLDVVPAGLLFYALGYYARRYRALEWVCNRTAATIVLTVVCLVGSVWVFDRCGYVNTHGLTFGKPLWYVIGGLVGSLAIIGLSMVVERFTKSVFFEGKRILLWYGRNSLYVLGFQSLLIRLYVEFMNTYRHTSLGMYTFPWSHAINCTILVGFIACPLLVWAVEAVRYATQSVGARTSRSKK